MRTDRSTPFGHSVDGHSRMIRLKVLKKPIKVLIRPDHCLEYILVARLNIELCGAIVNLLNLRDILI